MQCRNRRLALVELESETGISNINDKTVLGLIQEANARGFTLIANQAQRILDPVGIAIQREVTV
jgi:hypothetical protein